MSLWGTLGSLGALLGGGILTATGVGGPAGLALIGAGAGGMKHSLEDEPRAQRERQLQAETQRYAPWTGLVGKAPEEGSAIGDIMSGGVTGLTMAQGLKSAGLLGQPGGIDGGGLSTGATASTGPSLGVNTNLGYGAQSMNNFAPPAMLGGDGVPLMGPADANYGSNSWSSLMKKQPSLYG